MGKHPLPGYGPVAHGNRLVRTRMLGGVGAGGEIPPATRLNYLLSLLQNELLAALRARCKARMLIFDFLSGEPKQLIGKQDDNAEHQVKGYLAVPLDHDIIGTEIFFQPTVRPLRT